MAPNKAAYLVTKRKPLEVREAPYPTPSSKELIMRVRAVAINPVDWMIAAHGSLAFNWLKYPMILGSDMAGEVVDVGSDVKRFRVGDRVVAMGLGTAKPDQTTGYREGSFQSFAVAKDFMTTPIPDSMSFEDASVLPLAVSTAACGLYQKDYLALQHPSVPPKPTGKTVLVWGGSTSVGCAAIQLAVSSGYEVFTTCSPRNFPVVKKLGASEAFDYNDPNVVSQIVTAFKGKDSAGALAIGAGSVEKCLDIVHKTKGSKFVAAASMPGAPSTIPITTLGMLPVILGFLIGNLKVWWKYRGTELKHKFIFGSDLVTNEVGPAVYADFLPEALKTGQFVAAPEAMVVGSGLEKVQEAFEVQRKGVSAKKVVVTI